MTVAVPISKTTPGTGYNTSRGQYVDAPPVVLMGAQTLPLGVTVGPVFECGALRTANLTLATTAKAGSNPTCDVTIQTSDSPTDGWRTCSTFAQKTDSAAVGSYAMSAVTPAGTTPPTVTLTTTGQVRPVNFRMECTTLGVRGTAVVRYSIDGGVTWVSGVATAATIAIVDPNGTDTGLVVNFANATSAVDNVWTATMASYERKAFAGLDRYVRAVALIGGTATPTMDASVVGELT